MAIGFGMTLLLASLVLGGKDTGGGGDGHDAQVDAGAGIALAVAPVFSLRFWVFFLAFGGGAGFALEQLGSSELVAAAGALGIGWIAGAAAVAIVHHLTKHSVSSALVGAELAGTTGKLVLPVGPGKPGKVRVEVKGRAEDFVANSVDDAVELPSGTSVMVVGEGEHGTLLVTRADV